MGFNVMAPMIVPLCEPLVNVQDWMKIPLTFLPTVDRVPVSREQGRQAIRALEAWGGFIQLNLPGRKQETLSRFLGDARSFSDRRLCALAPLAHFPFLGSPTFGQQTIAPTEGKGREPMLPERGSELGRDMRQ